METKFSSKIDGWLIPVVVLTVGGLVAVFKSTYYLVRSDSLRKDGFLRAIEQARQQPDD